MKLFLLILTISFAGAQAYAERTQCDFNGKYGIKNVVITSSSHQSSEPGTVEINYSDSRAESLSPVQKREGMFNQISFSKKINKHSRADQRNYLAFESSILGDVFVSYTCYVPYAAFYCVTRGGAASSAIATFNIGGDIIKFNSKTQTCDWTHKN